MTQIRRTGANYRTFQFLPLYDQLSTIRRPNRLEADCVAEGKTFRCVRPWVAPGSRTRDAPVPATNRNHRLRDLAGDRFLRNATTFRNPDLRSTDWYETFRLRRFDSRGVTLLEPGMLRNALPSPRTGRPPDLPWRS